MKQIKGENDIDDVRTALEARKKSNNVRVSEWRTDLRISHSSKNSI